MCTFEPERKRKERVRGVGRKSFRKGSCISVASSWVLLAHCLPHFSTKGLITGTVLSWPWYDRSGLVSISFKLSFVSQLRVLNP